MIDIEIKPTEYAVLQKILFKETGISLGANKQSLIKARLLKRLHHYKVESYADYLKIVQVSKTEKIHFINELSTNETYFFREIEHFNFLKKYIETHNMTNPRVWSAAASQGAEAYSIAMLLDSLKNASAYEVVGTDINTDVLEIARNGLYPFHWIEKIPAEMQKLYCLKGEGKYEGKFLVDPKVQARTTFLSNNLLYSNPALDKFDVIFLRNVLLYFNEETKVRVIENALNNLKNNGFLIVSMTETFNLKKISDLYYINSSIYQKVKR